MTFNFTLLMTTLAILFPLAGKAHSQDLPESGVLGVDLVYATSPGGISQLYASSPTTGQLARIGDSVASVPSRWAHRRRTLGALETRSNFIAPLVVVTPMGSTNGDGAIHLIDARITPLVSALIPTGNPSGYDLAVDESHQFVFSAEDNGTGTTLRGFSYANLGQLTPLNPPTLVLTGRPSAYVNRIGIDPQSSTLHIPTSEGIAVIQLSTSTPQMSLTRDIPTGAQAPATNPISFEQAGTHPRLRPS